MKNKSNKKNSGFTFLEVVISLAMVSLVFIALSSYFSSSIKANSLARRTQRASLANQTVLEEIKGYSTMEDIAKKYNNSDSDYTELEVVSGSFQQKTSPSYDGGTFTTQEKYYFLRKMTIDDVPYKVLITINALPYNSADGAKYNTLDIPEVNDLNSDSNALIVETNQNEQGVNLLWQKYQQEYYARLYTWWAIPWKNATDIQSAMERTLIVEINNQSTDEIKITAHFEFSCPSIWVLSSAMSGDIVYDKILQRADFKNLYFFYKSQSAWVPEQIVINNNENCVANAYLVCQDTGGPSSSNVEVTGTNSASLTYYSNVSVQVGVNSNVQSPLISTFQKQRFTDVTVQTFLSDAALTPDNVLSELKTTRGE